MAGVPVRRQPTTAARKAESTFERHQRMVAEAVSFYGERAPEAPRMQAVKTDQDVLRESYRFIREEADDAAGGWEVRIARHYYSKLFREYCIADLSQYKEGKVGLRWRTQQEVVSGQGHFICGAKGCEERGGLESFEVNLSYREAGTHKNALVKLRVCPAHSLQLNYKKNTQVLKEQQKRKLKEEKRAAKKRKRRRRFDEDDAGQTLSPSVSPSRPRMAPTEQHAIDREQKISKLDSEEIERQISDERRSSPTVSLGRGRQQNQQEMDDFLESLLL